MWYACNENLCKPCHYSCIECKEDESSTTAKSSCEKCDALSLKLEPNYGICEINYVDISQFRDINIEIVPKGDEYNDRATIGFWIFFQI